ncbi:Uncharacterised protein [Chlamydia trachomatis]|nr:Uncharacterised protein [Chlamydia trachomatis]CRH47756.1 Uncharacterised protein [Chlamydia trachomatis]
MDAEEFFPKKEIFPARFRKAPPDETLFSNEKSLSMSLRLMM